MNVSDHASLLSLPITLYSLLSRSWKRLAYFLGAYYVPSQACAKTTSLPLLFSCGDWVLSRVPWVVVAISRLFQPEERQGQ